MGDIVSPQAQTSPYIQLREKFKCIEHIDKSETQLKTSPWKQKIRTKCPPVSDDQLEPCNSWRFMGLVEIQTHYHKICRQANSGYLNRSCTGSGKAIALPTVSVLGHVFKMLKFILKFFVWWARLCQVSCPVRDRSCYIGHANLRRMDAGCHGRGKISGKWNFFQVREKSGNFVDG